jgi:hypothetical protein
LSPIKSNISRRRGDFDANTKRTSARPARESNEAAAAADAIKQTKKVPEEMKILNCVQMKQIRN